MNTPFKATDFVAAPCLPEMKVIIEDAESYFALDEIRKLKEIQCLLAHPDKHMEEMCWVSVTLPLNVIEVKGHVMDAMPLGSMNPDHEFEYEVSYPKVVLKTALVTVSYQYGFEGINVGSILKLTEEQLNAVEDIIEQYTWDLDVKQFQHDNERYAREAADCW